MKKRILFMALVIFSAFVLVACADTVPSEEPADTPDPVLTAITFSGTADLTLDFDQSFNVLTGVTATGNDGLVYTSQITYVSVSAISATHMLDTTKSGIHAIRYEVKVGAITAQTWRYVTVKSPAAVEGEFIVNGDFALGTAGWRTFTEGSVGALSIVDGALNFELTTINASQNWQIQIIQDAFSLGTGADNVGHMELKAGQSYRVTFDAKATVAGNITLAIGHGFAGWVPYSVTTGIAITTEMLTKTVEFTLPASGTFTNRAQFKLEMGMLFAGSTAPQSFTLDNVKIIEIETGVDETAPTFEGVANKSILANSSFNPLAGVTAYDMIDGDVTADITVVITDKDGAVVAQPMDTSVIGTYTVTYKVEDAAGNEAVATMTLEVVGMLFTGVNLVTNPSFSNPLKTENPEWFVYYESYTVTHGIDTVAGVYELDIAGAGTEPWHVQLVQENEFELVQGKTYRIVFNAKAEVARTLNVTAGVSLSSDPWYITYMRENGIQLTTDFAEYEVLFTVTQPTSDVKVVFELGSMTGFAEGKVTFAEVIIEEAVLDEIVTNGDLSNLGWVGFANDWDGSVATLTVVNGEFVYTLSKYVNGSAGYMLQLIYGTKLVLEPETTYTFKFDAYASKALSLTPFFTQGEAGGWNNLVTTGPVAITTTKDTYTLTFTTGTSMALPFEFKFEFGTQFTPFEAGVDDAVAQTITFDNLSMKKVAVDAPELLLNGTADVLGFSLFTEGAGQGTIGLINGKMVVDITGLGGEAYQPHVYQMIGDLAPGNYVLKMVIESDVTRDLRVNLILPDSGYASILSGSKHDFNVVADVEKVVVVEFTVTNTVTNVKLELDLGTLGGTLTSLPGEFTISEILIYQNFN